MLKNSSLSPKSLSYPVSPFPLPVNCFNTTRFFLKKKTCMSTFLNLAHFFDIWKLGSVIVVLESNKSYIIFVDQN